MPWNPLAHTRIVALVLVGGCVFDADYGGGTYKCTDGRCPSGLVCTRDDRCVTSAVIDAAIDVPVDTMIDARMEALTCADPGLLASGVVEAGDTTGGTSRVSASCGGFVMNGADRVYRITSAAGDSFRIEVTGLRAYAISACITTPPCIANMFASAGNPIVTGPSAAGPLFVVVDHEVAPTVGPYSLTVTKL